MCELFEQKYRACEKNLFLVATAYLHNTEDAKDCLQEAAIRAYLSYDRLQNKAYFKTWMTRIVINQCKDFLKSRTNTEELRDDLDVFYEMPSSELEIMDALCRLPPEMAKYISLRFYVGLTYEETAKSLRIPVSTVKYQTKRALCALRTMLKGDLDDES